MIQRIAVLFVITGAGHIFSIIALRMLAQQGQNSQIAGIGEVESLIQLMIGLIGFGMQSDAIRNISLSENWQQDYHRAQTARITLSLVIMTLSLFAFADKSYLLFLMAPVFAASGDYALYARGFSVSASLMAFARVVFPLLSSMVSVYFWPSYILETYVVATFLVYLSTNLVMSHILQAPSFYAPSYQSLTLYIKTFPLGIITLCFYFFGLGLLIYAQFFFNDAELVLSFLALKFYLVYKGALRVIHQAFINKMLIEKVCESIDQISVLLALAFVGSVLIFPNTFITLFFGNQFVDDQVFFVYLALAALAFSLFSSASTRVLLERRDYQFMLVALSAVLVTVLFMLVSFSYSKNAEIITLSLLAGEVFFAAAVAGFFFKRQAIWNRISYLFLGSLGLALPISVKWIFAESLAAYLISFSMMGIILLLVSYKNFTLPMRS